MRKKRALIILSSNVEVKDKRKQEQQLEGQMLKGSVWFCLFYGRTEWADLPIEKKQQWQER